MANYVPKPIKKIATILKGKILSLYDLKTSQIDYRKRKTLSKPKIEKESKDNIIKNLRNLFKLKNEKTITDQMISAVTKSFWIRRWILFL